MRFPDEMNHLCGSSAILNKSMESEQNSLTFLQCCEDADLDHFLGPDPFSPFHKNKG